jgi:hypothetical protein
MFQVIGEAPAGVLAFRAIGHVSTDDYATVLMPAIEAAAARGEGIRIVIELGPDFEGYSAGAGWEDLNVGAKHLSDWRRCAVVTDHRLLADAVRAVGIFMPGEYRVFPVGELETALDWAAAS